jgi:Tfp pilus assembly protein PilF
MDDPVAAAVAGLREDPRALLARGIASATAGDVATAVALHEAALERDPSLVHAHGNLLSLYGRLGDHAKAEAHYRAALAAKFENADLHYDIGVVFGMQQKWVEAEDAYRRAIAINGLHANARNNLGQLLERRREFAAAAAQYREAIAAQPSFRLGRFNYGRMLIALGRTEEAIAELARLQQPVDAETPRYVFALSAAYVRGGRIAEGRERAAEAHRLALRFGQTDLAAAIERELGKLR